MTWCLAACLTSPWALAQGGDKASAEILFNDGRRLMDEGKLDAACEKLAESHRLDPAVGTLLNLADCLERRGQTASAWATWLEAASGARAAGQTDREAHARQKAEALKARLVTLTIDVPEAHRVAGLAVARNGTNLGPALWGTAAPVDPGTHRITATAPGYQPWSSDVIVREGSPASVIVPQLTADAAAAAPPSAAGPAAPAGGPPVDSGAQAGSSGGPPIPAIIAGGVGVIGLGVGVIFGLQAMSKNDDSKEECRTATLCNEDGVALRDDAFTAATVSTVGFVVGAAGLAAGAVLWATAPKSSEESSTGAGFRIRSVGAAALPGSAALTIRGAF